MFLATAQKSSLTYQHASMAKEVAKHPLQVAKHPLHQHLLCLPPLVPQGVSHARGYPGSATPGIHMHLNMNCDLHSHVATQTIEEGLGGTISGKVWGVNFQLCGSKTQA